MRSSTLSTLTASIFALSLGAAFNANADEAKAKPAAKPADGTTAKPADGTPAKPGEPAKHPRTGKYSQEEPEDPNHAQPSKPMSEAAQGHMKKANEAAEKKQYHQAAAEWDSAQKDSKDPVWLWNVGDAYEKAGEAKKAIEAFRGYAKAFPKDGETPTVEKRIKAMEAANYKIPDQSAKPGADKGTKAPATK